MNEARRALFALAGAFHDEWWALHERGEHETAKAMSSLCTVCEKAADKLKAYERGEASIPEKV